VRRRSPPGPVFAALLAFLAFLPALDGAFLDWDDRVNLLDNPGFRGLGWGEFRWMLTSTLMGHWIPVTWLSFALNYQAGGLDPWGYHLGNLLLHAANAALFCALARRLLAAPGPGPGTRRDTGRAAEWGALVAAAVFAVHPLRAESVAWVTERRDVLSAFFYLAAVLAYVRGVPERGPVRGGWRIASVGAFALALGAKAMAMTLPATLLLLDWYPLRRPERWPRLLREKVPYLICAAAAALIAVVAVSRGATWTPYAAYGLEARVAMVGYSLTFYPSKWLFPVGLSPIYELPARVTLDDWRFLWPLVAALIATAAFLALAPRFPGGLAAWAHQAIVLAPVSGIAHAGYQLAHDRYSYLSGLGWALLAGAGVTWLIRRVDQRRLSPAIARLAGIAAALAILGLGAGAWRQSQAWRDSETLWRAAVEVDATCAICRNNMGHALARGTPLTPERAAAAEAHFRAAIAHRPDRPEAYQNLGALMAGQGRHDEAEAAFRSLMQVAPHLGQGPAGLGMLRVDQERWEEAIPLLRRALEIKPAMGQVQADLERALRARGN
jgi:tetratricopeptide (TPR) repeat protein